MENKELLEQIEKIINGRSDDLAVALSRSFERLEERIDAIEARMYTRLVEIEDTIKAIKHE
jgi:hypothetical protein